MKQIFKVIFFLSLMLSFSVADMIKDDNTTLKEQNLTQQVDELYQAMVADNYDKVKTMLYKNPKLVNLEDGDGERLITRALYLCAQSKMGNTYYDGLFEKYMELFVKYGVELNFISKSGATPLQLLLVLPMNISDKKILSNTLIRNGADVDFSDNEDSLPYTFAGAYVLENIDMFDYYLSKSKVDINKITFWINSEHIYLVKEYFIDNKKIDSEFHDKLNSKHYQKQREVAFKFTKNIIETGYVLDINNFYIILLIRFYDFVNDEEFLNLIKNN